MNSVCRRRGRLALKGCPSPASPAGLVTGRHNLPARPGPWNYLCWTNSFSKLPRSGSGSAGLAHLTVPTSRGGAPTAPLPKRVPGAERGARRGRPGSSQAAPARPRGGTGPAPTAQRSGCPAGPRRPYPQDVVALRAAAGDVDALRGAHGRKRRDGDVAPRAAPAPRQAGPYGGREGPRQPATACTRVAPWRPRAVASCAGGAPDGARQEELINLLVLAARIRHSKCVHRT